MTLAPRVFLALPCALLLALPAATATAADILRYTFEQGASDGELIENVPSEVNSPALDAAGRNGALYSTDVPGPAIYDPVADTTTPNAFSMDASSANDQIRVTPDAAGHALLATDEFTVEFFVKLLDQHPGFVSLFRRSDSALSTNMGLDDPGTTFRSYQVDMDSSNGTNYGSIRSRFDTYDPVAMMQTDYNRVALGHFIYIDNASQTGSPGAYLNTTMRATEGDDVNDLTGWHHVAITVDAVAGQVTIFTDYHSGTTFTLDGTFVQPDGMLDFGKLWGGEQRLFLDELRYSDTILGPDQFLRVAGGSTSPLAPEVVAHFRFEDAAADDGEPFPALIADATGSSILTGRTNFTGGAPTYSDDIPGIAIADPLSGTKFNNTFSMATLNTGDTVSAPQLAAFDSESFTVETFVKFLDEPSSFNAFVSRRVNQPGGDDFRLGYIIDYDHNSGATTYGQARIRFDTPGANADGGDTNRVVRLASDNRLFIDTDGMTNNPTDYTAATGDVSDEGDGVNDDIVTWHHVALVFDGTTNTFTIFFDYIRGTSFTLAGAWEHPAVPIQFGSVALPNNSLYLFDEFRYTAIALDREQFLRTIPSIPPVLRLTDAGITRDAGGGDATLALTFTSSPDFSYTVEQSTDLVAWTPLASDLPGAPAAATTDYTATLDLADETRLFFRVAELLPPLPE